MELSLPTQLSTRDSSLRDRGTPSSEGPAGRYLRSAAKRKGREIETLRQRMSKIDGTKEGDGLAAQLSQLEQQHERDLDRIAGLGDGAQVNVSNEAEVHISRARTSKIVLNADNAAQIHVSDYQDMREPERVPLLGSLPEKAALQPGSTDVWTIRLGSGLNPFFIPARYRLQITVIYGMTPTWSDEEHVALHSNTTAVTVQVRAALWSVILGGVVGGMLGSLARSLQAAGTLGLAFGDQLGLTIGALALALILSGAAVIFSARKAEAQSFITVEDFWGGVLVGFIIGYSGTAAFAELTGLKS